MLAIARRRFGCLVLIALIILSGGCGCDDDPERCVTTLDAFFELGEYQCLSKFDEMIRSAEKCSRLVSRWGYFSAGRCEGGFVADIFNGPYGYQCFYDRESEELIGIAVFTNTPEYCERTSYTIAAGTVLDCSYSAQTVFNIDCKEHGVDGEGGTAYTGGTGGSSGTMDAGRLDGSSGTVDHDDSGTDDDAGN